MLIHEQYYGRCRVAYPVRSLQYGLFTRKHSIASLLCANLQLKIHCFLLPSNTNTNNYQDSSMSLTPPPPGLAAVQARPLKRAAPRFLGDEGSDNEADVAWKGLEGLANKRTTAEDVDWLFADLDRDMSDDDDEALPAPMDRSAFAEQDKRIADGKAKAAAQAAAAIIDDSITGGRARGKGRGRAGAAQEGDEGEDGEKKSRKKAQPRAKIDEARLMGDRGFRKLRDNLKGFKIKGKGHEVGALTTRGHHTRY